VFAPGQPPTLWQAAFPPDVQAHIVSTTNHAGDITNSDLKQAGVLGQANVAASLFDLRELMLVTVNDNLAAVSCNQKGAVTLDQAATYLCWLLSLHRHHYWYYHEVSHIKGLVNAMADFLSWHFDLTEPDLLTYFNTHFPRDMPWRLCHLLPVMHSMLISVLRWQMPNTASWLRPGLTVPISSTLGWLSPTPSAATRTSMMCPPPTTSTFFIIYTCQYHCGSLSCSTQPIGAQRVEEALRAMGQESSRIPSWMAPPMSST
jgi:hypothetical protein